MEASTAIQSRLIGAILVDKNLITAEQLERALQLQADTGERLGEIVVAEFGVARLELASVLAEQWAELEKVEPTDAAVAERPALAAEPLTPAEVHIRRPIGEIFVELGFISSDQLDAALDAQRETGARIGEILVEQGSLTRLDLASALAEQWSALQKLRPPEPAAEPQPWQNGAPVVVKSAVQEWSADDRSLVAALEERLRVVERAASATPWQEDLRLVTASLRSAVGAVEARLDASGAGPPKELVEALDAVNTRIDALESESISTELDSLRQALEELSARPVDVEGLSELRDQVERLEARPNPADDVARLASEITTLAARLDEIADVTELTARLDAVASQAEGAHSGLAGLASRVDDLASLQSRVDELAVRLPGDDVITEVKQALSELAARPADNDLNDQSAEITSLEMRLDQLAARVEDVAATSVPDVTPRIDELAVRIGALADTAPVTESHELAARLESLEESGRAGSGALERLATELGELGARTQERLDALVSREPESMPIEELRSQIDQLAAAMERESDATPLVEIRVRLDELAASIEREPDSAPLAELRARVDYLSAFMERAPDVTLLDALRSRVDELAVAVERGPDMSSVDGLSFRVGELTSAVERASDPTPVNELRARVDDLAALAAQRPDTAPLDDIRARVEELAVAVERAEVVGALEARVDEMEHRLATATPAEVLRNEMRRVAESTVVERESLEQALFARVEEITATIPREDELLELRSRLDEVAARPTEDRALQVRVDDVTARLDDLGAVAGTIADLRESLEGLAEVRVADALATGARLAGLEAAVASVAGLEARIRDGDDLADRSRLLAARLDGTESRLVAVGELEESVSALTAELKRRPDADALAEAVAGLRAEIEVLADRPTIADPGERLLELSRRIDRATRDGQDRIGGLAEELNQRVVGVSEQLNQGIAGLAERLDHRVDDLAARADGLVSRDEAAVTVAEQAAWVRAELEALREAADERTAFVDAALAEADHARTAAQQELGNRIDGTAHAIRTDLDAQTADFGTRLEAQGNETTALREQVESLQEAMSGRADWEARIESMLEQRLDGLAGRITDEVAGARVAAEEAATAVRGESSSLAARIDEMVALRHTDLRTARDASERLAERVEELAGLHAVDADAARGAAVDLSERLTSLAGSLHAEAADARTAADRLAAQWAAQIGDLHGLRTDDLAATELAGAELAARLDDHALRSAAAAFEVEQALREELGGVAARLEERDAQGIEAREELRGELERVASSVGWRLERIEESLSTHDTAELKSAMAEVERRLEGQVAVGEEQVRATERALRKGLASLGERLVTSESAYVEAGNTFRRSIERLGAAVIEADARMADQIPVSDAEGCVAFAPTAAGYRLVELPGKPPEVGSSIELEGCDGALVVTRYGRSPLPLDNRPCAYLDRA